MSELKKYLPFTIFFAFLFIANLATFDVFTTYRGVVKALVMGSLIGFYIGNVEKQDNGIILAMIFALFGDVFLLFEGETFFMIGLSCFLVMQLLYSVSFARDRDTNIKLQGWFLLVAAIGVAAVVYMIPKLGDMQIPVVIYSFAIMTMSYLGIHRKQRLSGYNWVAVGCVFFVISDMVLALGKFVGPFAGNQYFVMATYMVAQYAIVRGIILHQSKLNTL